MGTTLISMYFGDVFTVLYTRKQLFKTLAQLRGERGGW
jgi:hypothetical protein